MKLTHLLIVALSAGMISCKSTPRKPSSVEGVINLQKETETILSEIRNPSEFNLKTCVPYIQNVYHDVLKLPPTRFDSKQVKENWKTIFSTLWEIRIELRERLKEFYTQTSAEDSNFQSCSLAMRDGFRLSRWVEDYLAETFSGQPQDFKVGEAGHVYDPKFNPKTLRGDNPWLMVNPKFKTLKIRSGDVITSRGNAYTSSAIARIGEVDSQFSHLAFIFVAGDGQGQEYTIEEAINNPKVLVLESLIEIGSKIRPFREYVESGNARNVVFRYPDAKVAHEAARWSYEFIQNYRSQARKTSPGLPADDVNYSVPYNFQMDLEHPENPKKLFCTQVAYVGFYNQNVVIPLTQSKLNNQLSLPRRLGIQVDKIFAPGDMEVDPRFEMVAEYRNIRRLKGVRIKDMVLSSMFKMMDEGYELTPRVDYSIKSLMAWTLRQLDFKFVKQKLPKNMNVKILNTVFTLDTVAMHLEDKLNRQEARYMQKSQGLPLTFHQGLIYIEQLKNEDRQQYVRTGLSDFHSLFRPKNLYPDKTYSDLGPR